MDFRLSSGWLEQQQQRVDLSTYVELLRECSRAGALEAGRRVHAHITKSGSGSSVCLGNHLLQMYAKCGSLDDARAVFSGLPEPNVFSWTLLISAHSEQRQYAEAVKLFRRMDQEGMKPDKFVFSGVLCACSKLGNARTMEELHARVRGEGLETNAFIGNTLVSMYGKCGWIEEAKKLFDRLPDQGVVAWNALISGYVQNGLFGEAFSLLRKVDLEGVKANAITFISLLDACCSLGTTDERLIERIAGSGFDQEAYVASAMVNMYGKCGRTAEAKAVFDEHRTSNVVLWNSMMGAYTQCGYMKEAMQLMWNMDLEGIKPSRVTFILALEACWDRTSSLLKVKARVMEAGFGSDMSILSCLIRMLGKSGDLEQANQVFNDMKCLADIVSWNSLISGYSENGDPRTLKLLQRMDLEGVKADQTTLAAVLDGCDASLTNVVQTQLFDRVFERRSPDAVLKASLVRMLGRCGSLDRARQAVDSFLAMNGQDASTWNAMLAVYAQRGEVILAAELQREMEREGVRPSAAALASLVAACAAAGEIGLSEAIEGRTREAAAEEGNYELATAAMSLYSSHGDLVKAAALLEGMSSNRDVVAWTSIVVAYGKQGLAGQALQAIWSMSQEGVPANAVTFTAAIQACSHAGMLEQGRSCFEIMVSDHGIEPDQPHFACLVDLMARVGKLGDAVQLAEGATKPSGRGRAAWMSLLSGYRGAKDVAGARNAARLVIDAAQQEDFEHREAAPYVMLHNAVVA